LDFEKKTLNIKKIFYFTKKNRKFLCQENNFFTISLLIFIISGRIKKYLLLSFASSPISLDSPVFQG